MDKKQNKVFIYELGKELKLPNKQIIRLLKENLGINVKSHSSSIAINDAINLKKSINPNYNNYIEDKDNIAISQKQKEIKQTKFYTDLKNVPKTKLTSEMCTYAVSQYWGNIKYVPEDFFSEDLCILAISQHKKAFNFIPQKYRTDKIMSYAIKKDYRFISFVKIKDEDELCKYIKINNDIFKHMLPEQRTNKICTYAFKQNKRNIMYIPYNFITKQMCIDTIKEIKPTSPANRILLIKVNEYLNKIKKDEKLDIDSKKNKETINNTQISENYEEIINSKKYRLCNDLISIQKKEDKIFNLYLIRKRFTEIYPESIKNLSTLNKNSSSLKIKTKYEDIYYSWLFRKSMLEVNLEFDNTYIELLGYFNSIEQELKKLFIDSITIGQTKKNTIIFMNFHKYNLDIAINKMNEFISIIGGKLDFFFKNNKSEKFINEDNKVKINDNNIHQTKEEDFVYLNINDGQSISVQMTRYERNPKNRAEAIRIHGTTCLACGFNFNKFYGEDLAKNFIEIHHIKPVSQGEYTVNPRTDLVPLCSNCHSIIHKEKNPPKTIDEIRNRYKKH